MSPMVPMKVLGLTLDAENNAPILVLQQDGGSEIVPIWIGASEALAISVALNGTRLFDRPLTHETMFQAIAGAGRRYRRRGRDSPARRAPVAPNWKSSGGRRGWARGLPSLGRSVGLAVRLRTRPSEWPARCWPKLRPPAPPDAARHLVTSCRRRGTFRTGSGQAAARSGAGQPL